MELPEVVQRNADMAKLVGKRVKIIIVGSSYWMAGQLRAQGDGWNKDNGHASFIRFIMFMSISVDLPVTRLCGLSLRCGKCTSSSP